VSIASLPISGGQAVTQGDHRGLAACACTELAQVAPRRVSTVLGTPPGARRSRHCAGPRPAARAPRVPPGQAGAILSRSGVGAAGHASHAALAQALHDDAAAGCAPGWRKVSQRAHEGIVRRPRRRAPARLVRAAELGPQPRGLLPVAGERGSIRPASARHGLAHSGAPPPARQLADLTPCALAAASLSAALSTRGPPRACPPATPSRLAPRPLGQARGAALPLRELGCAIEQLPRPWIAASRVHQAEYRECPQRRDDGGPGVMQDEHRGVRGLVPAATFDAARAW